MTTAAVLLAAGASRRYGADDKLLSSLRGRPLVLYAAEALRMAAPGTLIAVAKSRRVKALLPDFEVVEPIEETPEQADSLRAGVARAEEQGASEIVVVLADMPFVTADLIASVLTRGAGRDAAATTDGLRPMPPALFAARLFPRLLSLSGDRGAGSILKELPETALVRAPATVLTDIDTPADLARAQVTTET